MIATPPSCITATERLDEVAAIMAAGIARLVAKNTARSQEDKSPKERSFGLDFAPPQRNRGHDKTPSRERK